MDDKKKKSSKNKFKNDGINFVVFANENSVRKNKSYMVSLKLVYYENIHFIFTLNFLYLYSNICPTNYF